MYKRFLVVFVLLLVLTNVTYASENDKIVNFKDENLKYKIIEVLNRNHNMSKNYRDPIKKSELLKIEYMPFGSGLNRKGLIKDLSGLEHAKNLKMLNVRNNKVKSIEPLRGLKNLITLNIAFNYVTDLSPLSSIENLENLMIDNNASVDLNKKIEDLSPIRGLTKLKILNLNSIGVTDEMLKNVENLLNLERIFIYGSSLSDSSKREFMKNRITNIEPLKKLIKLKEIYITKADISDLSPIMNHLNVTNLNFEENKIESIEAVKNMKKLEYLNVNKNRVYDMTPLLNLNKNLGVYAKDQGTNYIRYIYPPYRFKAEALSITMDTPPKIENVKLIYGGSGYKVDKVQGEESLYFMVRDQEVFNEKMIFTSSSRYKIHFNGTFNLMKSVIEITDTTKAVNENYQRVEFLDGDNGKIKRDKFKNVKNEEVIVKEYEILNGRDFSEIPKQVVIPQKGYAHVGWSPKLIEGKTNFNKKQTFKALYKKKIIEVEKDSKPQQGYHRVEFLEGENGKITTHSTFDVLDGVKFNEIEIPQVKANENYSFISYSPEIPKDNPEIKKSYKFLAKYKFEATIDIETVREKDEEVRVNTGPNLLVKIYDANNKFLGEAKSDSKGKAVVKIRAAIKDEILTAKVKHLSKDIKVKGDRIAGEDRIITATEVSKEVYDKSDTVIIVNGFRYPDALTSTVYADLIKAPILLVQKDIVPKATINEIKRLGAKNIILVGGELVISKKVAEEFEKEYNVKRVGGVDRYHTSVLVADEVVSITKDKSTLMLSRGDMFSDALTISTLALKNKAPIILTEPKKISNRVHNYIKKYKANKIYIAGGNLAVSKNVEKALSLLTNSITRFAGSNRYDLAIKIAEYTYPNATNVVIASGESYVDSMVSSTLTKNKKAPILLVEKNDIPKNIIEYIKKSKFNDFVVVGGEMVVSNKVLKIIKSLIK